jgi:hypothetical protein
VIAPSSQCFAYDLPTPTYPVLGGELFNREKPTFMATPFQEERYIFACANMEKSPGWWWIDARLEPIAPRRVHSTAPSAIGHVGF